MAPESERLATLESEVRHIGISVDELKTEHKASMDKLTETVENLRVSLDGDRERPGLRTRVRSAELKLAGLYAAFAAVCTTALGVVTAWAKGWFQH